MPYNTAEFLSRLPEPPLSELYSVTPEHLTPYLTYIKEHRRIFRATVEQVTVLQVNDAYRDLNRYVFTPILKLYQVSEADREYVLQFFIGGLMAVNRKWLQEDCRDSIEHVIAVTQHCIRHA